MDPLTDDCVSPEAERHRSQQVEQVRAKERTLGRVNYFMLTTLYTSCPMLCVYFLFGSVFKI